MKKSCFVLIYLLISISVSAQSLQIGIGGGSTFVTGSGFYKNELNGILVQKDFKSDNYTLYENSGLNFNSENNIEIKARLGLKNSPLRFATEISYHSLTGKGTIKICLAPESSYAAPPQKTKSSCHLLNGCLGAEYELSTKNIIPVLSGGIVLSHLGDIEVKSIENNMYQTTIQNGGIRMGLDFGAGVYFKCHSKVLVGISSKFTMNNLVNRNDGEEKLNTIKTNLNVLYEL